MCIELPRGPTLGLHVVTVVLVLLCSLCNFSGAVLHLLQGPASVSPELASDFQSRTRTIITSYCCALYNCGDSVESS